jgi:putative DNA primase/helicase
VYRPFSAVQIQGVATKFARDLATQIAGRLPGGIQARNLQSCSRINQMIQLSRSKVRVEWSEIDKSRNLVGLADGSVFDLGLMQLVDQSQSLVTKSVGTGLDQTAACPNWTKFLDRIFAGDREIIDFVQRAVGYTLSGEVGEQCLFLLIGNGANGKSTFINALNHLFGDYAATIPMHTLMLQRNGNEQTNDLALLPGKRFVAASEGEPGQKLAESKIKLMTGGDRISCRPLYQDLFAFDPQFKLWLATNSLPRISGIDEAIWRRIRVIRFPVTIPVDERDPDLGYTLQSELPGILNWALEGYRNWKQQKLNPPDQVMKETGAYRLDNDTVGQFIEACCEKDPWAITTVKDLYDRYVSWSEQSGYEPVHRNMFGKTLAQKDFMKVNKNTGSAWKGLSLKPTSMAYEFKQRDGLMLAAQ